MGVMLALSAVFAVVISTISMPGDRALGQTATMTNSEKVADARDALEDALVDPDLNAPAVDPDPGGKITQLQAAVAAIPAIQTDLNNDGTQDTDTDTNPLSFAIEVDNPAAAEGGSGETGAKISISAALTDGGGGSATNGLNEYLAALLTARGPAAGTDPSAGDTTEAGALLDANTAFTALRGMLWNHDAATDTDGSATASRALTDATKSTLDRLNNGLLTATPADLAVFKTSVEDALKSDTNWYPDDPATALPTANVVAADTTTTVDIAAQLNALFNPNTADDGTDDSGALVVLKSARTT